MTEFDTLLPLSFALPTAAMPRYRPFGHGPSMGAFGQQRSFKHFAQTIRKGTLQLLNYLVRAQQH